MAVPATLRPHIVLVGDGAVGKTAQIWRIVHNMFEEEYDPTIDDWTDVNLAMDDGSAALVTFEESGHQEDSYNRDMRFRRAQGIAFFVSITNPRSYESIVAHRDEIIKARQGAPFKRILVATKSDLEASRKVTEQELEELAAMLECPYVSASAKTGENCSQWAQLLAASIASIPKPPPKNKLAACVIS